MTLAVALAVLVGSPQTFDLRLHPSGKPVTWNILEDRVEGKVHTSLGTKVQLVATGTSASLTLGPFTSQGRTFGRPKVRSVALTPQATLAGDGIGRPPFLMSIPLPGRKVKVGDTWTGVIVGPTPMPAGVKMTFRVAGVAVYGAVSWLRVSGNISTELGGAKITGTGTWNVKLADGLVQNGSLNALLIYLRPDPVTRKMTENARVRVKATSTRS